MRKLSKLLCVLCATVSALSFAEDIYVEELVSVYDGDTFRVNLGGDMPEIFGTNISVRVGRIDTPELRTTSMVEKKMGYLAKDFAKKRLTSAKEIVLKNVERGKYFRILADVYIDGVSLADELVENDFAVPYDGGTKSTDWEKKAKEYFEKHAIEVKY